MMNPESIHKHDPYINKRFIELFDADENANLKRMFTMGLAINDPELAVEDDGIEDAVIVEDDDRPLEGELV